MGKVILPGDIEIRFPGESGDVSDSYHTFNEIYAARCSLFAALMLAYPDKSYISRLHADGSSYDGWFLAGMNLDAGPISYHLPDHMLAWFGDTAVSVLDVAPEWDGHTSEDVLYRLATFCAGSKLLEHKDECE
jgi:hypothetical protein